MEALKSELEAYGCADEALPGESRCSLGWRESPAVRAKAISRLIKVLKSELEAYCCANEALPGENQSSLGWGEVSR